MINTPETDAFEEALHPSCRFPNVLDQMRKLECECNQLRWALGVVVPQHSLACVTTVGKWSFLLDDDEGPLITPESCACSEEIKRIRSLLPLGHPKGFSKTKQ